jgi:hypothetical protein
MTFGSISVNWISNTLITALLRKYNHKTGHSTNGFIKPNTIQLGIPDFIKDMKTVNTSNIQNKIK